MAKYEIHSAFDPKYPFIFHTDDIFEYSYSYANWHKNIICDFRAGGASA